MSTPTQTPHRRHRRQWLAPLLRRWGWLVTATALLAGGVFAGALLLTGGDVPATEASGPSSTPSLERVRLSVQVITRDGFIGHNHDDHTCVLAEMQWELRDAAGEILATDRIAEEGASVGDSRWASTGRVDQDPYSCTAQWSMDVPAARVYQLTVTTGPSAAAVALTERSATGTVTFERPGIPVEPVVIELVTSES